MTAAFLRGAQRFRTRTLCLALLLVTAGGLGEGRTQAQARHKKLIRPVNRKAPSRPSFFESRQLRILVIRLRPGQDLRQGIEELVKARNIHAGFILTAVGSLMNATIRLADQKDPTTFTSKFEIVSLVGTLGQDGVHLHIAIADSTGKTIGGHLVDGCLIYTTAEIVIGDAQELRFSREQDEQTGYKELRIRRTRR